MMENGVLPFPLPPVEGDTWQVGFVRFPGWVDDEDPPYRPMLALAASAETSLIGSSDMVPPSNVNTDLAQEAIESLAETLGERPAKIEVDDTDLAQSLSILPQNQDIEIECRDDLPLLDEPVTTMYQEIIGEEPLQAATGVPGVTIEHLRAFADAAEVFRKAAPWRHLDSSDIIEIGAPRAAPTVRFACVLNAEGERGIGLAGERSVLEFADTNEEEAFTRLENNSLWSVTDNEPWEIPIAEHDLWMDHHLIADPVGRVPAAVLYGPKRRVRRASPKMLAFFEGLFRALAETTEDELDSGKWERVVETSQGKLDLKLSLPDILDPPQPAEDRVPLFNPLRQAAAMEGIRDLIGRQNFESEDELRAFLESEVMGKKIPEPRGDDPKAVARELALEAMDTPGRRGIALARRALEVDPDSPVAHLALAEHAVDPKTAVERFGKAMAAAESELDPELFQDEVGSFWLINETRPYMEARKGLGDALWLSGQRREAVEHYQELLRLNPNDNQGIRDRLAPALLALGEDRAAEKLLDRYAEDVTAAPHFNRALVTFRRKGDGRVAGDRLIEAIECNHHVAEMLLGRLELPAELPPGYSLGSPEEAMFYLMDAEEVWEETPGALEWLADHAD